MIDEVKRLGDCRAILCWDQDWFGRFHSIETGEWISPLRRAGVEWICVVQGRISWDDFAGRMTASRPNWPTYGKRSPWPNHRRCGPPWRP